MSYTPPSEEINEPQTELLEAIKRFNLVLQNRIYENGGGWNTDHLDVCSKLRSDLEALHIRIRSF